MSVFRNNPNGGRPLGRDADPDPAVESSASPIESSRDLLGRRDREREREVVAAAPEAPAAAGVPTFMDRDARSGPTPAERCVNVIAAGSRWNGSLNIEDSVRIEGQLSGEV